MTQNGTDACTTICGDGILTFNNATESCDDGNLLSNDGCDSKCQVEPGWVCDNGLGYGPSRCWKEETTKLISGYLGTNNS
jgi:cysteine-rich repeat protein